MGYSLSDTRVGCYGVTVRNLIDRANGRWQVFCERNAIADPRRHLADLIVFFAIFLGEGILLWIAFHALHLVNGK
jgi:hypothetical protein